MGPVSNGRFPLTTASFHVITCLPRGSLIVSCFCCFLFFSCAACLGSCLAPCLSLISRDSHSRNLTHGVIFLPSQALRSRLFECAVSGFVLANPDCQFLSACHHSFLSHRSSTLALSPCHVLATSQVPAMSHESVEIRKRVVSRF